jgi:HD-like signal output (HDOD) protein
MHSATTTFPATAPTPHDLAGWSACLARCEIPVLPETAAAIEALRANEDAADAHGIADLIAGDPLMTLKVLAHAATLRSGKLASGVETVTAALVMMGIAPFFRAFGPQPTVDDRLADRPEALAGLRAVLRRAHRAARFALAFAVHRTDPDAAVIHDAALLHDFTEMLLWCEAPQRALAIKAAQADDPALRSADAQMAALGTTLADVQQALMRAWRLPELLARLNDDRHAEHPSVRCVALAVRVARHSARGWDDAALPDDMADLSALLNLAPASARALVKSIDA